MLLTPSGKKILDSNILANKANLIKLIIFYRLINFSKIYRGFEIFEFKTFLSHGVTNNEYDTFYLIFDDI